MKPRFYLDVGAGNAFDSHTESGSTLLTQDEDTGLFSLSAANHAAPSNLAIGAGFLWTQLYQASSPYFPFLSLGIQYQNTNFDNKKTLMALNFLVDNQPIPLDDHSHYVFSQNSLLGNLKLDLYRWGRVMPYLNLGLGASWNQAKEQDPFIDSSSEQANALITSTTRTTAFSYNIGAGLDFLMTEKFWLSLGYSYNNFGRVQIGKLIDITDPTNQNQLPNKPFNLGNLAIHNIQLTGRYVFG